MRITEVKSLFPWDCLEDSPSLRTVREFLATVPDERLLDGLDAWRGRGRDDYPVSVLWGVLLLKCLLRHATIEGCLGELQRNEALRRLIGIESEQKVPKAWNMSRFMKGLGSRRHLEEMKRVFEEMIRRLGEEVKDLGHDTAGDSTGLSGRRLRAESGESGELPEATGGRKEYTDEEGKVTKVVEWFGYKLHLLVDVKHEVAVAYRVSSANAGDNEELSELVKQAQKVFGKERVRTLAYDKACDDGDVHELLDGMGIKPVIENRALWKDEMERMLPGHDGRSNIVYDEAGTVYCYDKTSDPPVRHRMAYIGHEPARHTIKYRCPARHERWSCPSDGRCNGELKYGKTVRVSQAIDLRRFPAIPRATKQFERLYKGRSAAERVNARLKVFWGADDGNVSGAERFHAHVGAVLIVHAGLATVLATTPREGSGMGTTLGMMRLTPIAKALRKKLGLST